MSPTYFINSYKSNSIVRSKIDVELIVSYSGNSDTSEVADVSVTATMLSVISKQHMDSEWLPVSEMPSGLFDVVFKQPDEAAVRHNKLVDLGFFDHDMGENT